MGNDLPIHRIRESPRARRVLLRLSHSSGLEIVVPRGFSIRQREVEELLTRHAGWIERARKKFSVAPPARKPSLPSRIELPTAGLSLGVFRERLSDQRIVRLRHETNRIVLSGNTANRELCRRLLVRFLRERAAEVLPPLLHRSAKRTGLSYGNVAVRVQKTRWGSFSSRGTISLNAKLLFLPLELTDHVLVHELCHSRHLNHGPNFYALLARFQPRTQELEQELRRWERRVPRWMHG